MSGPRADEGYQFKMYKKELANVAMNVSWSDKPPGPVRMTPLPLGTPFKRAAVAPLDKELVRVN
jgi:hypothetical protein